MICILHLILLGPQMREVEMGWTWLREMEMPIQFWLGTIKERGHLGSPVCRRELNIK
jgi:hypothetical protein